MIEYKNENTSEIAVIGNCNDCNCTGIILNPENLEEKPCPYCNGTGFKIEKIIS